MQKQLTYEEIGQRLGISATRVQQLDKSALQKIARRLVERGVIQVNPLEKRINA